ncbi:MAG: hypothetical protein E6Q97_34760 [Desulfurellales bacterium]|nr:MAG: hypothetical protein E6Q97_34760 [Desulfurellales bacterium]
MPRSTDYNPSEEPAVERKYYQRIHQQVDEAIRRLEARGFFRDEPPKRKFGIYRQRKGSK